MPVSKENTRLTFTVSNTIAKEIEDLAEKEQRTVSAMSAILIEEAIGTRDKNKHAYLRGTEYYARS